MAAWKVRMLVESTQVTESSNMYRRSAVGRKGCLLGCQQMLTRAAKAAKLCFCCFVQAAAKLWPTIFSSEAARQKKEQVLKDMEVVRPVIETG